MADYRVRLDVFEGPMDLLVYLIRKNEIDIYDIPIALIADQYNSFLEQIDVLDLEKAGEFLLMSATLLQIKSRMLLPGPVDEEGEYEDPRTELVEKILEHMQFSEIAEQMRSLEHQSLNRAERGYSELEALETAREGGDAGPLIEATVNELIMAFGRLLVRAAEPEPVHRVEREQISVAERTREILGMLKGRGKLLFSDLLDQGSSRLRVVVTLVALLEMARRGELAVEQSDVFSELWIARRRRKKKAGHD